MASINSNAILRRKATAARETWRARAMSPEKALRLALAKSADELLDLALIVLSAEYVTGTAAELKAMLSDDALLCLVEGPGGVAGAASIDVPMTTALVEQQTMGRVGAGSPDLRRLTRTDAAMVAPLLDDTLLRMALLLEGEAAAAWVAGHSFGVRIENVRLLALALEAPDFHIFRLHVDLAGARQGTMILALPFRNAGPLAEGKPARLRPLAISAPRSWAPMRIPTWFCTG